jgi:hypothetical protein
VLLFYAFLYLATSKKCDDECQKLKRIGAELRKDSAVYNTYQCGTAMFCMYVDNAASRNWTEMANEACGFMMNEGLRHYTVNIVGGTNRDTLAKSTCP